MTVLFICFIRQGVVNLLPSSDRPIILHVCNRTRSTPLTVTSTMRVQTFIGRFKRLNTIYSIYMLKLTEPSCRNGGNRDKNRSNQLIVLRLYCYMYDHIQLDIYLSKLKKNKNCLIY